MLVESEIDQLREENRYLRDVFGLDVSAQFEMAAKSLLGLSPQQCVILNVLVKRGRATREQILTAMAMDRVDDVDIGIVGVQVYRLRQALQRHGIVIGTIWGYGYELSDTDREKVLQLIPELPQ